MLPLFLQAVRSHRCGTVRNTDLKSEGGDVLQIKPKKKTK